MGAVTIEKRIDDGCELVGLGQDAEVSAVVDVQLRVRDQGGLQPRVGDRDDRVVVAAHHQRRLPQEAQERQARPADHGRQLVVVAALGAGAGGAVQQGGTERGVGAHRAAVDLRGDLRGVRRVTVASRGGHDLQHAGTGRHHQCAGAGRDQHHPAYAPRRLHRQLLGQAAAPGEAEDVEAAVPEPGHQRGHPGGQPGDRVGQRRQRGAADTRNVEADDPAVGVQLVDQRLQRLEADADAVAQQERRLVGVRPDPGPHGHPGGDAPDRDVADAVDVLSGHGHRCRGPGPAAGRWRCRACAAWCAPLRCGRRATPPSRPTSCP